MTTAIDTNVVLALWDRDRALNAVAQSALDAAFRAGNLVMAGPVFSELMAAPGRDEGFLDLFLRDTAITIDWDLDEATWRSAGRAFQAYATDRRKQRDAGPRRIVADFLIGAHALHRGFRLLTIDDKIYRKAFPRLAIARI